jgi:hypothetical protein
MEEYSSMKTMDISAARFAPMRRLLSGEDEEYLLRQGFRREAAQLRAHHRRLYFRFVNVLEKDFKTVYEARKLAMAENWNFESLLRDRLKASYYLWTMRAAGAMHFIHLPQAAELAQEKFDQLPWGLWQDAMPNSA